MQTKGKCKGVLAHIEKEISHDNHVATNPKRCDYIIQL